MPATQPRPDRQIRKRSEPESRWRPENRTNEATLYQVMEQLTDAGIQGVSATELPGQQRKAIIRALAVKGLVASDRRHGNGRIATVYQLTPLGYSVNLEAHPLPGVLADVLTLVDASLAKKANIAMPETLPLREHLVDVDETRRLLYGLLFARHTRQWELAGTIANALLHHNGTTLTQREVVDMIAGVLDCEPPPLSSRHELHVVAEITRLATLDETQPKE